MDAKEKRKRLAQWILETEEHVLNEVEAIYNVSNNIVSEKHKKILDERFKLHQKNPKSGKDWNELKAELSSKYVI